MGTSVYSSLLIKDYQRKLGEIARVRKQIRELCRLVQSLERQAQAAATLVRAREPDVDLRAVKVMKTTPRITGTRHGWMRRTILSLLRDANGAPVRADIILHHIIEQRREPCDREQQVVLAMAIRKALRNLHAAGKVERHHQQKGSSVGRWSIAPDNGATPP